MGSCYHEFSPEKGEFVLTCQVTVNACNLSASSQQWFQIANDV
jgi:hypothetical protein